MKIWKFASALLCLAAVAMFGSTCYGQNVTIFVGSSGAYNSFAVAGVTQDPISLVNGPCAATDGGGGHGNYHLWTAKSTSAIFGAGIDSNRNAAFPNEPGNLWVEWDNSAAPTTVCAYLIVDTIVGNRLFFGTYNTGAGNFGRATLAFPNGIPAVPAGGGCIGGTSQAGAAYLAPYLQDDAAGLPCTVFNAIVGQQFTAAVSDIRPEDAEYATQRAAAPCAGGNCATDKVKAGLGYGGPALGLPGLAIKSAFSNTSAQVIGYSISGNDPASGVPVLGGGGFTVTDVGAYPMMIFVGLNRPAVPCATDFAAIQPTNVPSHTLALIESGTLSRTTDLNNLLPTQSAADGGAGLNGCPITILHREAMSGTFNTFEYQIPHTQGLALSQEVGVNPALVAVPPAESGNPLWHIFANGSVRARVIGAGEMVKAADGDTVSPAGGKAPNTVGYSFWTFASYAAASAQSSLRYLTLDGVDPIQANYFAPASAGAGNPVPVVGQLPACVVLPCRMPFTNLKNGGYRNWNIIRLITATNPALDTVPGAPTAADIALATSVVTAGQDQSDPTVGNLTDFVPFQDANGHVLTVFRSHYNIKNYYNYGNAVSGTITSGVLLNGTNPFTFAGQPAYADNGGDMNGAIFNDQNDMDSLNDFGPAGLITGYLQ